MNSPNHRDILFGEEARKRLLQGVEILERAVGSTLGPAGQNVVFARGNGQIIVTKDGVTVAEEIHLADPHADQGVSLLRAAARRTAAEAGDGTTATTILGAEMFRKGLKLIAAGVNSQELRRGMELCATSLTAKLRHHAQKVEGVEDIASIATISANGDSQIGNLIAELMEGIGQGGIILMEDSGTPDTTSNILDGFHFDRGWLGPVFAGPDGRCVMEGVAIVLIEGTINFASELNAVLSHYKMTAPQPFLIICESMRGEAAQQLMNNIRQGRIKACVVQTPSFGQYKRDTLADLGIATGADVWFKENGSIVKYAEACIPGRAQRVVVNHRSTIITGGGGSQEAIAARIQAIEARLADTTNPYDREDMRRRIARLSGGIGVIYVGGKTEAEVAERKARVEDAINAAQGAVSDGILPGGGVALAKISQMMDEDDALHLSTDQQHGWNVVLNACSMPLRRIATNAGAEEGVVLAKVWEVPDGESGLWWGYDALHAEYVDLSSKRIIDPAKVVIQSLNNAVSAATMLLTTDTSIIEVAQAGQE